MQTKCAVTTELFQPLALALGASVTWIDGGVLDACTTTGMTGDSVRRRTPLNGADTRK